MRNSVIIELILKQKMSESVRNQQIVFLFLGLLIGKQFKIVVATKLTS